jgi:predicted HTH domain antitoxin
MNNRVKVTAMQVVLQIPDELESVLAGSPEAVQCRVRLDLAVNYYREGVISLGKAAEMSGVSRLEFERVLGERGTVRNYSAGDLEQDLHWARQKA